MKLTFPTKPFRTHGGAKVPHRKNTEGMKSTIMTPPQKVVISMSQHIGAPCKPTVKKGDLVSVGDIVGNSESYVSAPVHASVSGVVSEITTIELPNGNVVQAVVIESDGEMRVSKNIKTPKIIDREDLVKAARDSGLVGLGGAGFPVHVKINIPIDKEVDTLIVNVAECEPYITADHSEALENSEELFEGIYKIKSLLRIDRVIIAVEDNKPDVIEVLNKIADNKEFDPQNRVRVLKLKSRYPQGAEKVLVKACTNREIPGGKLPADVGCLIMNVTTISVLSRYLRTGMPLITKRITIDGSAIKNPQNVIVPIGAVVADVIDFCGGFKEDPKKILMGGPMMGLSMVDTSLPILKQNNAILAFNEKDATVPEPSPCIRCGRCVENCPMGLMPTSLEAAIKTKDIDKLKSLNIMTCMECGCCAYNCPAGRQLVQSIRLGKNIFKSKGKR